MPYRYIRVSREGTYDADDEKEIAAKVGHFQLTKIRFLLQRGGKPLNILYGFPNE